MRVLMVLSFMLAFVLSVLPLSGLWAWLRPELAVLLVIYWSIYYPQQFGLLAAAFVGLGLDLVEMTPLGFNMLGVLLIACICQMAYQRVRNYLLWQQAVWVFVLVGVFQLFCNWLGGFYNRTAEAPYFLVAASVSSILWVLICKLVAHLQVRLRLN